MKFKIISGFDNNHANTPPHQRISGRNKISATKILTGAHNEIPNFEEPHYTSGWNRVGGSDDIEVMFTGRF